MSTNNLAQVAAIVSDASRSSILTLLLDGKFHTAKELAYAAKIKPQTASFHLAKMVDLDILMMEKHGRHRYFRIFNHEVSQVLESLLFITPPVKIKSFKQDSEEKAVRYARTCYDHLAGKLGVQLANALVHSGILCEDGNEYGLTPLGEQFFIHFQIDLTSVKKKRRSFSHKCLDWSERTHHLAGALGTALLDRFLELDWIQQSPNTRAVSLTEKGRKGLKETFSIEM